MTILNFSFFKIIKEVEITITLRVSFWLEENNSYLMPCRFKEIIEKNGYYNITIEALDPNNFISNIFINKKFLFGHPGKIVGYGILNRIELKN